MAVVVVNCPTTMMSLSEAALAKVNGIQHRIDRIIGPSKKYPTGKNGGKNILDALNVWTLCGKQIDAYPETTQGIEPCGNCAKSRKTPPPTVLVRVMPPVRITGDGWRWASAYWARYVDQGFVHDLIQHRLDVSPTPRAETVPAMRPS